MIIYAPNTDPNADLLMARWWLRMRDDGDLEKTFLASAHTLGGFMALWADVKLMLELDDEGITVAMWVQHFMHAGHLGLWVRSDKRHHLGTVRAVMRMYRYVFSTGLSAIIGVTKQEHLLEEHERLGYKVLGRIPKLWDTENDGWVVVLAASDFYARWGEAEPTQLVSDPAHMNGAHP